MTEPIRRPHLAFAASDYGARNGVTDLEIPQRRTVPVAEAEAVAAAWKSYTDQNLSALRAYRALRGREK